MSKIKSLKQLKKADLVALIENIYGLDERVDDIVNHHISPNEQAHPSIHNAVQRQIKSIRSETEAIDGHTKAYAETLTELKNKIYIDLRRVNVRLSLLAMEDFLWLSNDIYQRLDDTSDSDIGRVFRESMCHWLELAAELRKIQPTAENWVEKVLAFFDNNDYGVFDHAVSRSKPLLNQDELKQLAWRFNASAKKALSTLPNKNSYCSEAAEACFGLRSLAEAMGDIALFEKSYLMSSPTPNVLQMESIVRFALSINQHERAKYWLDQPQWQTNYARYKSLRNQLLQRQGNTRELISLLAEDFSKKPCDATLAPLWDISNSAQKKSLFEKIRLLATTTDTPKDAIDMLFRVGNYDLADELLVLHWQEFSDNRYGKHPYGASKIDENVHPLACILRD